MQILKTGFYFMPASQEAEWKKLKGREKRASALSTSPSLQPTLLSGASELVSLERPSGQRAPHFLSPLHAELHFRLTGNQVTREREGEELKGLPNLETAS